MGSPTSGTAQGEVTPHCTQASLEQKSSKATIQGADPKNRGNSCSWQGTEEEPILGGKDRVSLQPPSTSSAPAAKDDDVPTWEGELTSARDHGSAFPQAHHGESESPQLVRRQPGVSVGRAGSKPHSSSAAKSRSPWASASQQGVRPQGRYKGGYLYNFVLFVIIYIFSFYHATP